MTTIQKVNDTTVAEISERKRLWGSTELAKQRAYHEEELARIIALQDALK